LVGHLVPGDTEWRLVLDAAMSFATNCGTASLRANVTTRKLFNISVFQRIPVVDGKLVLPRQGDGSTLGQTGKYGRHDAMRRRAVPLVFPTDTVVYHYAGFDAAVVPPQRSQRSTLIGRSGSDFLEF